MRRSSWANPSVVGPSRSAGDARPSLPLWSGNCGAASAGFTLLEVLIAVAILAISLSSLMGSQIASMRAIRYSQQLSAAAFLAEWRLIELEFEQRKEGWVENDVDVEGDFSEQGWPNMRYECLVDFVELPEYNELLEAKTDADRALEDESESVTDSSVADTGEQAFSAIGMVWPQIKQAIETSIRKATCTVFWKDGDVEHDFDVATYWTDEGKLENFSLLGGGEDQEESVDGTP